MPKQKNTKEHGETYPRLDGKTGPLPVIYEGEYYDLSLFYEVHPGGEKHLTLRKGKDITKAFHSSPHPHTRFAYDWMKQFKVESPEKEAKLDRIDDEDVDWGKGLMFRIQNVKNYNEWIDNPVHRPLKLFDNNFLESLTVTKWYVVPIVWVPVSSWSFYKCLQTFSLLTSFNLWIFGFFMWTLIEYTLHKYVFHIPVYKDSGAAKKIFQFVIHGQHHKNPFDPGRLVFPPVPCAILVTLIYSILRLIIPKNPAFGILSGGLIGYVCYDLIHYYLHHGHPKRNSWLWHLRQHHNRHHFEDYTKGMGISNRFWDDILKSNYSEQQCEFYNGKQVTFEQGRDFCGLDGSTNTQKNKFEYFHRKL